MKTVKIDDKRMYDVRHANTFLSGTQPIWLAQTILVDSTLTYNELVIDERLVKGYALYMDGIRAGILFKCNGRKFVTAVSLTVVDGPTVCPTTQKRVGNMFVVVGPQSTVILPADISLDLVTKG